MERDWGARIATAGPIALLAAILGLALDGALSEVALWPVFAVVAILPVALCLWLSPDCAVAVTVALCVTALFVSLGVAAAAVLLSVPLAGVVGAEPGGAFYIHMMFWGHTVVVLIGSVAARARSGSPLLGPWLLWWIPVAAGLVWAEPLVGALAALAGVNALMGGIVVFAAPTLGMSVWVGVVSVVLVYARFTRGHLTMASTPTNRGSEVV